MRYIFPLTMLLFSCTRKEATYDCSGVAPETMVELIRICEAKRVHGDWKRADRCHEQARASACRPTGGIGQESKPEMTEKIPTSP
jgi:hypothetical protein